MVLYICWLTSSNLAIDFVEFATFKLKVVICICHAEDSDMYGDQVVLEQRRWKTADLDQDGKLTKEEYAAMYHPWDHKHMHNTVAQENLEDMDKDKDGLLSLQEYLGT